MDNKTQKERLEQELRFLKESFEAEVISKDEFEKGKDRIEKKLKEIQKLEEQSKEGEEQKKEDEQITEKKEAVSDDVVARARTEEKIQLRVIPEEGHEHFEPQPTKISPEKVEEPTPEKPKSETGYEKEDNKFFSYSIIFVVLMLVIFFSYSLLKDNKESKENKQVEIKFIALCSSNEDCRQEGKEGICIQAGTKEAKCEFKDIEKTDVIVLNDRKNCFNCDTQRVLSILESWFGRLDAREVDYTTEEGKNTARMFNAKLLPLYILDANVTKKPRFEQYKKIFAKEENLYVLSNDASGSTYYFKRDGIPNKLDLFVVENDNASIKAEKNLKEFLDVFKEVKFEKHLSNGALTKELEIKTFPSFLINNQVKFSGIRTAETIKGNFCKLNKLEACEKSLSKSLI